MNQSLPDPKTTFVVIIGASEFPNASGLEKNEAFLNSAKELQKYFLSDKGFALPWNNLLFLFDSEKTPLEQDSEITNFLRKRTKELSDEGIKPHDILIFYIGHGGFAQTEYFLALRNTKTDREEESSYTAKLLAKTLKVDVVRQLRKYLILDSCFAAAAYKNFQSSGPLEVAKQQTIDLISNLPPGKGTVLLCASGPKDPAMAPSGEKYTMFSGSLIEVFNTGDPNGPETLSFELISKLTSDSIIKRFPNNFVRPEVHVPDQVQGSIAEIPLFPNAARRIEPVEAKIERHEALLYDLNDWRKAHDLHFQELVSTIEMLKEQITQMAQVQTNFREAEQKRKAEIRTIIELEMQDNYQLLIELRSQIERIYKEFINDQRSLATQRLSRKDFFALTLTDHLDKLRFPQWNFAVLENQLPDLGTVYDDKGLNFLFETRRRYKGLTEIYTRIKERWDKRRKESQEIWDEIKKIEAFAKNAGHLEFKNQQEIENLKKYDNNCHELARKDIVELWNEFEKSLDQLRIPWFDF